MAEALRRDHSDIFRVRRASFVLPALCTHTTTELKKEEKEEKEEKEILSLSLTCAASDIVLSRSSTHMHQVRQTGLPRQTHVSCAATTNFGTFLFLSSFQSFANSIASYWKYRSLPSPASQLKLRLH